MQCNKQCTEKMLSLCDTFYNEKICYDLSRKHKFNQRSSSKLNGHELIKVLTLPCEGVSEDSLHGLCIRLKEFNPNADISASALAQRINTNAAVEMMKECFQ